MTDYTAVDCQGFAGGFTLGVAQAGFTLVGKREMKGGFGVANCEANRHLLGDSWQAEAVDPEAWSVPGGGADLVFGNPPCSGFSVLSSKNFRGVESKVNACMWAFAEYAARVRPQIAIFESVPLAFTQGHSLMRALRARLEEQTGESWHLTHVLHNALSVGGPAMRKRYFWVASRVPFGVDRPEFERYPVLEDVIGDLRTLDQRWDEQPYWLEPTWYSRQFRNDLELADRGVDGHISIDNPHTRRTRELLDAVDWNYNEHSQVVTRRYFDEHGALPPSWDHLTDKLKGQDFFQGFNTPTMWNPKHHARVITGAGLLNGVHWSERRTFTHREAARILGYPDNWLIEPLRRVSGLFLTWGKGITVHCGRWVADWARRALDGEPGMDQGELIGERESLIDVTNAWKKTCGTVKRSASLKVTKIFTNEGNEDVTEVPVAEAPAEGVRKGRPRPDDTIQRDQQIFDTLVEPMSRKTIAEKLEMDPKLVYLSLWRLRRDGRVTRESRDGTHVWTRVEG